MAADVLTNVNNTIQGSGQIGADQMALVNQGTIDANQATSLTIWTSNGTTNTGTLEATAGGNLILTERHFHQHRRHDSGFRSRFRGDVAKPDHQGRHAEHGQRRLDSSFRQPDAQRRHQ